jgi:hypothetical protein
VPETLRIDTLAESKQTDHKPHGVYNGATALALQSQQPGPSKKRRRRTGPYYCPSLKCLKSFRRKQELERHYTTHYRCQEYCVYCSTTFEFARKYITHGCAKKGPVEQQKYIKERSDSLSKMSKADLQRHHRGHENQSNINEGVTIHTGPLSNPGIATAQSCASRSSGEITSMESDAVTQITSPPATATTYEGVTIATQKNFTHQPEMSHPPIVASQYTDSRCAGNAIPSLPPLYTPLSLYGAWENTPPLFVPTGLQAQFHG